MRNFALAIALMANCNSAFTQETTFAPTNAWFTALNRFEINDHWSISNELHERFGDMFQSQGHFLFRPSIDYKITEGVIFYAGYTYIRSNSYDPYNSPVKARVENNVWEQFLLVNKFGKWKLQHRLRQEHRRSDNIIVDSQGNASIDGTNFANRFRYRITASRNIKSFENGQALFGAWFDEIWIPQGKGILPQSFARNWMYVGLGWKFSKVFNVQTGYMHQYDKVGDNYISSPIWQTTITYNFFED